jgi:PAS domain S-box-containing protein
LRADLPALAPVLPEDDSTFRNVVDAAPYGMLVVDDEGKIVLANVRLAKQFGYELQDVIGNQMEMLLPERYRGHHKRHRRSYREASSDRAMALGRDLTGQHRDGSEFPVEVALSPVRCNGTTMSLAVVIDLSHRKNLERRLREANARLEEFIYVTSHDLKAPLRGVSDLIVWIGEDLGASITPPVSRNLDRVRTRMSRMEQIVDDLLSYARAGRAATDLEVIDVGVLLKSVLELLPIPPAFHLDVNVSVAPFKAARIPLETTLRNLIGNACAHHDRPDGTIVIEATEQGSYCQFTIADDGPGIPLEARERVFRLFQTAAPSGGTGIGLAVTRRLVECHGGQIWFDDADGARGIVCRVLWPRFHRKDLDE